MKKCTSFLIQAYRLLLGPFIGNVCRFYPTCSHYAEEAIHELGFIKGCWLTLKRLGKCHPFHKGGYDPVPKNDPKCFEFDQ